MEQAQSRPKPDLVDEAYERWRASVEAEFGADCFERRLVTELYEGLRVEPLYVGAHVRSRRPELLPGDRVLRFLHEFPLTSPGEASIPQESALEWDFEGVWLRAPEPGVPDMLDGPALEAALASLPSERGQLVLDVGQGAGRVRRLTTVRRIQHARACGNRLAVLTDPLASLSAPEVARGLGEGLRELSDHHALVADLVPGARTVLVSVEPYCEAGAHAVQELGAALATGVTYLQTLDRAAIPPSVAARAFVFRVPVGHDLFLEMAKLRALRRLWSRVLEDCGAGEAAHRTVVHTASALHRWTRHAPAINVLRATVSAVASALGGADWSSVASLSGAFGADELRGRRLARAIQLVLRHEARITQLNDPGAGSYYLERLTDDLCAAAWAEMQDIQRRGGMAAVIADGSFAEAIERVHERRTQALACQRDALIGVTEFVDLAEPPSARPSQGRSFGAFPLRRVGESFESLRTRARSAFEGKSKSAALIVDLSLGGREGPRVAVARSALELVGLDAQCLKVHERSSARSWPSGLSIVAICPDEKSEPEELSDLAAELKRAGARKLALVARPSAADAWLRSAGIDALLHRGCDVILALESLLEGEETT